MPSFRNSTLGWCLSSFALCLPAAVVRAQTVPPTPPPADTSHGRSDAIRAFLDCQGETSLGCSSEFFVLELPYVTWTRDRLFADVQFLVTTIRTGSGAFQYTVTALGRGRFAGRADTAVVNTLPNESEDGVRRKLSGNVALLLVPYVRTTSAAPRLRLVYDAPANGKQATPTSVKDPWNFFVLQLQGNGFLQTESRQTFANMSADIRVRRITEQNALRFGWNQSVRYNRFEINDTTAVTNTIRNGAFFARVVKALGPRLSAGVLTSLGYSEFTNTELFWSAAPVIEYNLFPWKQATSRQVAISYGVGPRHYRWKEPTIFGRANEWRMQQELVIGSDVRQSWGSVNASARYSSYIPELKAWNLSLNGQTNLNVVKGLSFNVGGGASLIRDQIFLAARGQTPEQILTQRRALASNYNVFVFAGLSYSFGSIYNSVVNPRLDFFNIGGRR
ncbi:MAG: hypothetical protein H7305_04740 [Gemmatimonadaceae bacterium]|nr:hypothetical protein [Gemmatimonadaceae bacterium]